MGIHKSRDPNYTSFASATTKARGYMFLRHGGVPSAMHVAVFRASCLKPSGVLQHRSGTHVDGCAARGVAPMVQQISLRKYTDYKLNGTELPSANTVSMESAPDEARASAPTLAGGTRRKQCCRHCGNRMKLHVLTPAPAGKIKDLHRLHGCAASLGRSHTHREMHCIAWAGLGQGAAWGSSSRSACSTRSFTSSTPAPRSSRPAHAKAHRRSPQTLPNLSFQAGAKRKKRKHMLGLLRDASVSRPPATAVSVLKLCYQGLKIQPAAGDGPSSSQVVLPQHENPAGGGGRLITKDVLPGNENPAGRWRQPF